MAPLYPPLLLMFILIFLPLTIALVPLPTSPPPSPPSTPSTPTSSPPPPENICLNDCSGHGTCQSYTCMCDPPYSGDDCGHAPPNFFDSSSANPKLAPLHAGHFNVTSKKKMRKVRLPPIQSQAVKTARAHSLVRNTSPVTTAIIIIHYLTSFAIRFARHSSLTRQSQHW